LGIENMAYMEMPRKSTYFLLPLRLSIVFMSLNKEKYFSFFKNTKRHLFGLLFTAIKINRNKAKICFILILYFDDV